MCLKLDVSWSNLKVKLNDLTAVTVQLIRECRTKFFTICTDGHINGGRLMSKFSNLTILAGEIDNLCTQNENTSEESWKIFKFWNIAEIKVLGRQTSYQLNLQFDDGFKNYASF